MSHAPDDRPLPTEHATLAFDREVPAPVHEVFQAFASAQFRAEWGAPSETATIIYDVENFEEGGPRAFPLRPQGRSEHLRNIHYLEIVENCRIVASEMVETGGRRLCASLNTLELTPLDCRIKLRLTVPLASFVGDEIIQGNKAGHAASLDNLVRYFQARSAA